MQKRQRDVRSEPFLNPREFLHYAEDQAAKLGVVLRQMRGSAEGRKCSGPLDDTVRLAILIEQIARLGQKAELAEAIEIAERIELLFDQLRADVDGLLAS